MGQAEELKWAPAVARVQQVQPKVMELNSGIPFDANASVFRFNTLGTNLTISYPDCTFQPRLDEWHELTLLQCLVLGNNTLLSGAYMSIADYREGGLGRGESFNAAVSRTLARIPATATQKDIEAACAQFGGEAIEGRADITFRFWLTPRFPMLLNLWLADDEFPASGKILVAKEAESYLGLEAAGSMITLLAQLIIEAL